MVAMESESRNKMPDRHLDSRISQHSLPHLEATNESRLGALNLIMIRSMKIVR